MTPFQQGEVPSAGLPPPRVAGIEPSRAPAGSPPEASTELRPLTGFTVGVTAARRREELVALLERRGARVVEAPAIRIVPLADDRALQAATRLCLAQGIDVAVATTGIGFRGWLEAAESAGLADGLLSALAGARLLARGPKARGAIRAAGLTETWAPASECSQEVLDHLLSAGVRGLRIAVQLHGEPLPDFVAALRSAGASVIEVPVYRWVLPEDVAPLVRLVELVKLGYVDAVTFTSAPAAAALLEVSGAEEGAVLEAFRSGVLAACVGPVAAGPLAGRGVPTLQPARARLGGLVRTLTDRLPAHRTRHVAVAGHRLEIRGHAVVVDGEMRMLAPAPMAVLRALVERPGRVVSRADLLRTLPRSADGHAVEMAIARLRARLGDSHIVGTVTKRGYRLAVDPVDGR
ncbi:uroporphyrinogen-III synthase [Actinopolymorpha rutila]|uniref:Uroporphyrinogen-III synthase n=1 Tax=Actinopolymorpha rutila TaxID=446787 RepID=A0A852Z8U0_9ACTN|nr:uroporphyrinogen-III synthase [Actinopolymorpha rutila]NYH88773.1 uroporphyrinogen-III synthase [Actinopolymorpha rutila]